MKKRLIYVCLVSLLLISSKSFAADDNEKLVGDFCNNIGVLKYCKVNARKYELFIQKYINAIPEEAPTSGPIKAAGPPTGKRSYIITCAGNRDGAYEGMQKSKIMGVNIKQECKRAQTELNQMMKDMQ